MRELLLYKTNGIITNQQVIERALDELEDGYYLVKIARKNKRSDLQNRYYWGCVLPLALEGFRDIGYDEIKSDEDVHEIFKSLFLKKHHENAAGLVIEYIGSTKKLSKIEFMEYLERVVRFCSENLSISIPDPGQPILINY